MAKHIETGKKGETLAVEYLEKLGYQILEINWRHRRAEVDIIAKDGEILVFVEVKTRSDDFFGNPAAFVTRKKERFMSDAANVYMAEIGHLWEIRFDIIGIVLWSADRIELRHFKDAFFPGLS